MKRLLDTLTVASVLIAIVFAALWARSYWRIDSIYAEQFDRGLLFSSYRGYIAALTQPMMRQTQGWDYASYPVGDAYSPSRVQRALQHDRTRGIWPIYAGSAKASRNAFLANDPPGRWFVFHDALLVLVFAALPLARGWMIWRRRRRTAKGFCAACGYDLRASPERCPECGQAVRAKGA